MPPEPGWDYWDDEPGYPHFEWIDAVARWHTRLGYWDWVRARKELGE